MGGLPGAPEERFWRFVTPGPADECWEWGGALDRRGYGVFGAGNKSVVRAHRFAYELLVGPIPEGLFVCHACDNPPCVNPFHLWVGTQKENLKDMFDKERRVRGWGRALTEARQTHCKRGHPLSGDNLVIDSGKRKCRECRNTRARQRYVRRADR